MILTPLFACVLCCAVLCYAMLCYAMLCYAMLCYAMLCYAMWVVLRCVALLCFAVLSCALLWFALVCFALLCFTDQIWIHQTLTTRLLPSQNYGSHELHLLQDIFQVPPVACHLHTWGRHSIAVKVFKSSIIHIPGARPTICV
jgi:hypothetical protein